MSEGRGSEGGREGRRDCVCTYEGGSATTVALLPGFSALCNEGADFCVLCTYSLLPLRFFILLGCAYICRKQPN